MSVKQPFLLCRIFGRQQQTNKFAINLYTELIGNQLLCFALTSLHFWNSYIYLKHVKGWQKCLSCPNSGLLGFFTLSWE